MLKTVSPVWATTSPSYPLSAAALPPCFWSQIKSREALVTNALELDTTAITLNGKSMVTIHEELNQFLEEAAQALKDSYTILLGDLLEYELAPRAEQELEIVALLQAQIPATSG